MESWRGLSLWGYPAGSGVPVRPSSSSDYISNRVSPRADLSSQNTMSQIKSNLFSELFSQNEFATNCLVRRQKYTTKTLLKTRKSQTQSQNEQTFRKTVTLFNNQGAHDHENPGKVMKLEKQFSRPGNGLDKQNVLEMV